VSISILTYLKVRVNPS